MFQNYIRIALRNLLKRKGFTLINILGLAIGVACCLLILLYVHHELQYDEFHEKSDRIYRLMQTSISPTKEEAGATTPFKAGSTLEFEYPDMVESSVRFFDLQEDIRTLENREDDRTFRVDHFYFVDSTFFDVFDATLLRGNPAEALSDPFSIVITEKWSERYFEGQNPIGKVLRFKGIANFTVTGVMEPLPATSHMNLEMLVSFHSLDEMYGSSTWDESWLWNPCWTYILLKENASPEQLKKQLPSFSEKYYNPNYPEGERVELDLQPLADIHLYSDLDQEMQPNNSIFYIYLFSAVAALILLTACINFMNLSTARSAERRHEVGMRKVLGADRKQLFLQFMGESFLMSFLAISLALCMVYFALPWFNDFVGRELNFGFIGTGTIIAALTGFFIVVALLSGFYPAVYLSGFNPINILRGKSNKSGGGAAFRKGLVVFQFTLSVILIIGTVIVYQQLQHMQNKKLGFDKEQVIILPIKQNLISREFPTFKEQALQNSIIRQVAGASKILGSDIQTYFSYTPAASSINQSSTNQGLYVTHDFLDTYNIELLAGRSFSPDYPTDADQALIINEKMLDLLDVDTPGDAIGRPFVHKSSNGDRDHFSVIGVTGNFNYTSIKKEIEPLVIRLVDDRRPIFKFIEHASVKVAPNAIPETLKYLENIWKEINHIDPFTYSFHDEELDKIYASEIMMGKVAGIFAGLCIIVACLGLFGLASFTASLRTKEIGIRKTLGASISSIVMMLSKEYVRLVLIANIIAWPVIYNLAVQWLQNFPYRLTLGWNLIWIFGFSAVVSLLICLLTVSYQSFKAALVNPVDSIRRE